MQKCPTRKDPPCSPSTSIRPAATSCRSPGPSPVPDRILRAMSLPTIDHRGPEFGALGLKVLGGIQQIFKTQHPVVIYPGLGHRRVGGGAGQHAERPATTC